MLRFALAAVLAAFVAGLSAGAASTSRPPNREQVHFNRADQAAARAAILRRGDLGAGWSGGARTPPQPSSVTCPGYEPRQSDLVLTGASEARFQRPGLLIQSDAQVLKTRAMVQRDWERTVVDPRAFACVRYTLTKGFQSNERLSFRRLSFPRLARYTAAFRAVVRVETQGRSALVLMDTVLVGRSRTELTLVVAAPAAARGTILAPEARLARLLLVRVRA